MRNAWMWILAATALVACNNGNAVDAGPDTGFIMVHDSGPTDDTGPMLDTGAGHDVGPIDGNVPPYDGGPAFTCNGLTAVTPSTYCAALADATVAQYVRCGLIASADTNDLHAALVHDCDLSAIDAAVTAGTATWDADMAACCLAHGGHDISCFLNVGAGATECDFLHGTVANGDPCTTGAECMDGYCHRTDSCMGVCTAYAATGATCNLGDVTCAPDARCDTQTHRCTTETGTAGMTCSSTMDTGCLPTLACVDPDGDGNGICTTLPTRGQRCTTDTILCDLNSGICDYDYDTMTGVCAPAFSGGEMRCIIDAQCADGAYCSGANFQMMHYGTCTPRASRGESCATDKCAFGLTCRPDHTCGDAPTLGQPCTPTSGCDRSQCSGGGTCIARYPGGQHCTMDVQCASGICNPTSNTCAPECP